MTDHPPPPGRRPSRLRAVVGVVALLITLGVGAVVAWQVYQTRFPNLLDKEEVNPERVAALRDAPLAAPPAAAETAGWPQWRGPNRDGRAPAGPLRTDWQARPPKPVWSVPCGGGYSSFAVAGGRVYTQDYDGKNEHVLCLDADTGAEVWRYGWPADYGGMKAGYTTGPRATPAVHDGRVYAVGATGTFVCLEPPGGPGQAPAVRWRHDLVAEFRATLPQWGMAGSPLVEGDMVVVQPGGKDGSVAAFELATGEKKWAAGSEPGGYSSPVAATCAGVRQIVAATGESIVGIRAADGEVLWRYGWTTSYNANIATPLVIGDYVFVSSGYSKGCALLKLEPAGSGVRAELVYFRKGRVMRNHHSSCVYRDGFLYGYDDSTLKCVDLRKGEEVEGWVAADDKGRAFGKGSVILADKYLIGLTESGTLFLGEANPEEFRYLGQVAGVLQGNDCWAAPVLVGGRIYLRDNKKVVCLDVRPDGK